jgi:hypothetical protein
MFRSSAPVGNWVWNRRRFVAEKSAVVGTLRIGRLLG